MSHFTITRRAACGGLLAAAFAGSATAEGYPSGQVRLIVPTSPGGVTDVMARIVAKGLGENLKETVVVDNRPGGNGSVGAIAVAHSPPDGLNLLVTSDATITANPLLSSKLGYQANEFTPIIVLCRGTPVLVVNAKVPAKSVAELIALAKSEPGKLNYGSYGVGTYAHLSMEDFKRRTGTDIVHIPYRGAAPAAQALLAGDVNMLLLNYSSIADHEKDGKVRILAAAGDKRTPARPELPTIARGRRTRLFHDSLVRAVRSRQHAARLGEANPCGRQQGARLRSNPRNSSRKTFSSASPTRRPSSPSLSTTTSTSGAP